MNRRVRDRTKFQIDLNIFKVLSILLIVIFVLCAPFVIQKLIKINKIECMSQFGSCDESLGYKNYESRDYRTAKKGLESLLSNNVQVNDYLIQYKIPSTIKIDLNLKKPKYSISNSNNIYYHIAKDGVVVNITNESNLPRLKKDDASYKLGDTITDTDKFALELVEKISKDISINESTVGNNILKIRLNNEIVVLLPLQGDVDVLTGSLRLIFSRLNDEPEGIRMEETINISDIHEIDLRFKNPILR